jgi:hypothetical protein
MRAGNISSVLICSLLVEVYWGPWLILDLLPRAVQQQSVLCEDCVSNEENQLVSFTGKSALVYFPENVCIHDPFAPFLFPLFFTAISFDKSWQKLS